MNMLRKMMVLVLTMLMILTLVSCSGNDASQEGTEDAGVAESAEKSNEVTAEAKVSGGDILILYFSAANLDDNDATTGATPLIDGMGTTEWMAQIISQETGGDVVALTPTADYPLEYDECADYAKKEADNDERPAFKTLDIDPSSYQTIFIGYPVWWYRMPMILETFFDTYDLSGATIIPFNTHEGSRDGGTYNMIADREPDATVLEGIAIRGRDVGTAESEQQIREWLAGLELK